MTVQEAIDTTGHARQLGMLRRWDVIAVPAQGQEPAPLRIIIAARSLRPTKHAGISEMHAESVAHFLNDPRFDRAADFIQDDAWEAVGK